jgi:hypothetical protein
MDHRNDVDVGRRWVCLERILAIKLGFAIPVVGPDIGSIAGLGARPAAASCASPGAAVFHGRRAEYKQRPVDAVFLALAVFIAAARTSEVVR